jgi:hypothetical protein
MALALGLAIAKRRLRAARASFWEAHFKYEKGTGPVTAKQQAAIIEVGTSSEYPF